jgi:hypothetical protein
MERHGQGGSIHMERHGQGGSIHMERTGQDGADQFNPNGTWSGGKKSLDDVGSVKGSSNGGSLVDVGRFNPSDDDGDIASDNQSAPEDTIESLNKTTVSVSTRAFKFDSNEHPKIAAKQDQLKKSWEELKLAMQTADDIHEMHEDAINDTPKLQGYIQDQWDSIRKLQLRQLKKEVKIEVHWQDTQIEEDEWFPLDMLVSSNCMKPKVMADFKPVLRFSWDSAPSAQLGDAAIFAGSGSSPLASTFAPKMMTCPHNDVFGGSVEFHHCTWRPPVVVVSTRSGMGRGTSQDTQRMETLLKSAGTPFATVYVDTRDDPDAAQWKKMVAGSAGGGMSSVTTYPQLVAYGKCIGDSDAVQDLVDANKKTWLDDLRPPTTGAADGGGARETNSCSRCDANKKKIQEMESKLSSQSDQIRLLERKLETTKQDLKQKQTLARNAEKLRFELASKDKEVERLAQEVDSHKRELETSKKELSLSLSHIKDDDSQTSEASVSRKDLEMTIERLKEQTITLDNIAEEKVEEKRSVEKQLKSVRGDLGKARLDLMKEKKRAKALEESISILNDTANLSTASVTKGSSGDDVNQKEVLAKAKNTIEQATLDAQSKAQRAMEERFQTELTRMSKLHRLLQNTARQLQRKLDKLHNDHDEKQRRLESNMHTETTRLKNQIERIEREKIDLVEASEAERRHLSRKLELVEGEQKKFSETISSSTQLSHSLELKEAELQRAQSELHIAKYAAEEQFVQREKIFKLEKNSLHDTLIEKQRLFGQSELQWRKQLNDVESANAALQSQMDALRHHQRAAEEARVKVEGLKGMLQDTQGALEHARHREKALLETASNREYRLQTERLRAEDLEKEKLENLQQIAVLHRDLASNEIALENSKVVITNQTSHMETYRLQLRSRKEHDNELDTRVKFQVEKLERDLKDAAYRLDMKNQECENLRDQRVALVEDRKRLCVMNMDHTEKMQSLQHIYENKIGALQEAHGEYEDRIAMESTSRHNLETASARRYYKMSADALAILRRSISGKRHAMTRTHLKLAWNSWVAFYLLSPAAQSCHQRHDHGQFALERGKEGRADAENQNQNLRDENRAREQETLRAEYVRVARATGGDAHRGGGWQPAHQPRYEKVRLPHQSRRQQQRRHFSKELQKKTNKLHIQVQVMSALHSESQKNS